MTGRLKTKTPRVARLFTSFLETLPLLPSELELTGEFIGAYINQSRHPTHNLEPPSGEQTRAEVDQHRKQAITADPSGAKWSGHNTTTYYGIWFIFADAETWAFSIRSPRAKTSPCVLLGRFRTRPISRGHVMDTSNRSHSSTKVKKEVYRTTHANRVKFPSTNGPASSMAVRTPGTSELS